MGAPRTSTAALKAQDRRRQVARFDVRRYREDAQVTVFRGSAGWTVLTVTRLERDDDDGELCSAESWVKATELADIAALQDFLESATPGASCSTPATRTTPSCRRCHPEAFGDQPAASPC